MSTEPGGHRPAIWPLPDQRKPDRRSVEPGLHPRRRRLVRLVFVVLALILVGVATCGVVFWRLSATVTNYSGDDQLWVIERSAAGV